MKYKILRNIYVVTGLGGGGGGLGHVLNVIQHNLKLNYNIKANHSPVKEKMGRNP